MSSDAQSLSDLFHEFIGTDSNTLLMQERIKSISNNPDYYIAVACNGNEIVGTAMAIVCYDIVGNCNPYLLVENVVISNRYRGQGIGKLLMKDIEDFGQEHHCNYVFLVSGNNREDAHKFYESIGYIGNSKGFRKRFKNQI